MIDLNIISGQIGSPRDWQPKVVDMHEVHKTSGVPVGASPDLTRIAGLPRRARPTDDESTILVERVPGLMGPTIDGVQTIQRKNFSCKCAALFEEYGMVDAAGVARPCIKSLRMIQVWTLLEARTQGGLLGLIGVGHGKTFLDLLIAWAIPNCKTALLLVPPKLVEQLDRDYQFLNEHFHLPSITFHSKKGTDRTIPGRPCLHVLPYSMLNRPEATTYIEQRIRPDVIIADEVHKLKNADTATTGRVLRYFHAHPETRFCGWSGSMTNKSIKDYAHLAALALRHGSPLPIHPDAVDDWARALDPVTRKGKDGEYSDPAPHGALAMLFDQIGHPTEFKTGNIHSAFRRRLCDTPGVITTTSASVSSNLIISERVPDPVPTTPSLMDKSLAEYLRLMRTKWLRPDGMVYPDAMQRAAGALQLACGFFYRWKFPLVQGAPQDPELIAEWLALRKLWNAEVRRAIKSRKEHFDSEKLARNAAERAHGFRTINDRKLPVWSSTTYVAWHDIEHRVKHETEAIWIDDWLVRDAVAWGQAHRGIIWYSMSEFGREVSRVGGFDLHAGGPDAGEQLARVTGRESIVASIESHGTGRDGLQYKFNDQLITIFPSSNDKVEQLLGRLHRDGQASGETRAEFYRHTPEVTRATNTALICAGYVASTTPNEQKLITAGFEFGDDTVDEDDLVDDEE